MEFLYLIIGPALVYLGSKTLALELIDMRKQGHSFSYVASEFVAGITKPLPPRGGNKRLLWTSAGLALTAYAVVHLV